MVAHQTKRVSAAGYSLNTSRIAGDYSAKIRFVFLLTNDNTPDYLYPYVFILPQKV